MHIGPRGLCVRAPAWVPLARVEQALHARADWIVRKLGEQQNHQQRVENARIQWGHGATLPWLGTTLGLVLEATPGHTRGECTLITAPHGERSEHALRIALAHHAAPGQIRDTVHAWLMRQAHAHFTARLHHFAPLLGVRWTRLALSGARTRWGSAGADGSIRLNWHLMHCPPRLIDYVVVHELAHLRVMDHSPRFWATVSTVIPNHVELRKQLREQTIPHWH